MMRRHDLNADFQWQAPPGPFRRISQDQVRSWNENGYFLLEDAFDSKAIEQITAEIDPFEAAAEEYLITKMGGRHLIARAGEITFTNDLAVRSAKIREFLRGPVFEDLCHDLIGPDVRLYWDMAVYKKPGTDKPFPWHQDNGYTYVVPQQYVTCWVALTAATVENGCPWVLPGAHLQGTLAHRATKLGLVCVEGEPDDAVAVPVRAGSIAVLSSLVPHTTGSNLTTRTRKTLIAEFVAEGAVSIRRNEDGTLVRTPCTFPRNIPILTDGHPAT